MYDAADQLMASLTDCVIYASVAGRRSPTVNDLFFTFLPIGRSPFGRPAFPRRMLPINHRRATV